MPEIDTDPVESVADAVRRSAERLPGALRYRTLNALNHIENATNLLSIDREMSSFRAITAEEEAATAIIKCIQLRKYKFASHFDPFSHMHKAAIMACMIAIGTSLQPIIAKFQLIFDYSKPRIDLKIPLSNFDINGAENLAIQPVEPLDIVHAQEGVAETSLFSYNLNEIANNSNYSNIKSFVKAQSNLRNTLLYASDNSIPNSKFTPESLRIRYNRTVALLIISIMIWQSKDELALVRQAILAFLSIISKLPADDNN